MLDDDVAAIGLGVPGPLDLVAGRTYDMVNLPFHDFPLRDHMAKRFGLPTGLDNDANAAAIAEWRVGAGRGVDDLVMLTLGTGLGGGVISSGRPFRGAHGGGVELGHVVIVHDGRPCQGRCTGRGHLEAYVTGLAATLAAQEAFGPAADAHRLVRLANEGDETARGILADIGRHLGSGMGSFANIFEPQLIVIGGGFGVAAWDAPDRAGARGAPARGSPPDARRGEGRPRGARHDGGAHRRRVRRLRDARRVVTTHAVTVPFPSLAPTVDERRERSCTRRSLRTESRRTSRS